MDEENDLQKQDVSLDLQKKFMDKKKSLMNYCEECHGEKWHTVIFIKSKTGTHMPGEIGWKEDFMVVQCKGCENISFRKEYGDSDMILTGEDGMEYYTDIQTYPLHLKNHLELSDLHFLPYHIRTIYIETINAFKIKSYLLSAAGFRGVIESVCIEKNIKGNLVMKIKKLNEKGILSKNEADRLHAVRFLGNDSIHEIKVPTAEQLLIVLEIIKHLLNSLYLIDKRIERSIDSIINDYKGFIALLSKKIALQVKGSEHSLIELLGKDIRRVKDNLKEFEKTLNVDIKKKKIKNLILGTTTKERIKGKDMNIQKYLIAENATSSNHGIYSELSF
jgi:hypothetical protein